MVNNILLNFIDKVSVIFEANMSELFLKVTDENGLEFVGKVTSVKLGHGKDRFCVKSADESRYFQIDTVREVEIVERIPAAGYRYREVYCPLCKRKFMWEMGSEWMEFYYVLNSSGEKARQATCTTCSTKLAVFDGVLEGAIPSERVDLLRIREYGI